MDSHIHRSRARGMLVAALALPLLGAGRQDQIRSATAGVTPVLKQMIASRDRLLAAPVASCRRRIAMSALRALPPTKDTIEKETALPDTPAAVAPPPPRDQCADPLRGGVKVLAAYVAVMTDYAAGLSRAAGTPDVALGAGDLESAVQSAKALNGLAGGIPDFLDPKSLDLIVNGGVNLFANHVRAEQIAKSVRDADPAVQRLAGLFVTTFGEERDCDPARAMTVHWCSVFFSETAQIQAVYGALFQELPARTGNRPDAHELLLKPYVASLVQGYRDEKAARDADIRAGADFAAAVTEFARIHAHVVQVVSVPVAPSTAVLDRL
jgi:hypothetical protein